MRAFISLHERNLTQRALTSIPRNGDKRSGIERRRFSYHAHIPERRSGQDRRSEAERRELPAESYHEIEFS
jgi:hypothetical protein